MKSHQQETEMVHDFICFFVGHKYKLAQELSPQARRVCCTRCHKSFAMSDNVKTIVPWDSDFHKMYESHGVKIEYLPWEFRRP
jgi:hypothetical protein